MLRNRRRAWSEFFAESGYVAQVYLDSLRDNFVGYVPTHLARFEELKAEFDAMAHHGAREPYLADLLRIELALIDVMPDDVVVTRFWATDDRFRRVVPLATRDRYDRSVPPRGEQCWREGRFIRNQTHTLLHVIHSNYLLNIGREQSIKRLKAIMWLFGGALFVVGLTAGEIRPSDARTGILLLMACGVFGALLSITNRMQAAVAVDAMTQDGIYELTGLRVGWVGVLMSLFLGGGFALVLYLIVMAGVLDLATPRPELPVATADGRTAREAGTDAGNGVGSGISNPPPATAPPFARPPRPGTVGLACVPPGETSSACRIAERAAGQTTNVSVAPAPSVAVPATAGGPLAESAGTASVLGDPSGSRSVGGHARPGAAAGGGTAARSPEGGAGSLASTSEGSTNLNPTLCSETGGCPSWASRIGRRLGFPTAADFFKMMVLAFLAGFAERFVPDILNRLSKQQEK